MGQNRGTAPSASWMRPLWGGEEDPQPQRNPMGGFRGGRRAPDPAHRAAAAPLALAGEEEGAAVGLEAAVV